MRKRHVVLAGLVAALVVGVAAAQAIPNWSAPATWTPTRGMVASAMADLSNPMPFIPIDPCRVADTRGNGFTGEWGPPIMSANQFRDFTIGGQCGIPTSAAAVSFNFTVVGMGAGFLRLFPAGGAVPVVSTLNWNAFETKGNAAVVPLGTSAKITVNTAASSAHVIIDVNGYYGSSPAGGGGFAIYPTNATYGLDVINTAPSGYGAWIQTTGTGDGLHIAASNTTSEALHVVTGDAQDAHSGQFEGGWGVYAVTNQPTTSPIWAIAYAATGGYPAIYGESYSADANTAGILGKDLTAVSRTYGVMGYAGPVTWTSPNSFMAGGRFAGGGANSHGVVAEGLTTGIIAYRVDSSGVYQTYGSVGYLGTTGLYTPNDLAVGGAKNFVEPHPTDPAKVIKYAALEGPESGTYFRGRGRFEGRVATIEVPESFRMVTDEAGLSIQVTPIGGFATVYVEYLGLDQIVVRSTKDVEFYYMVNGVRKAYRDFQAVQNATQEMNPFFIPESASQTLNPTLPAEIRQRLVRNGTYNEDGTVNMDTAERVGWAQQWRDRDARMKAEQAAAAAKREAELAERAAQNPERR